MEQNDEEKYKAKAEDVLAEAFSCHYFKRAALKNTLQLHIEMVEPCSNRWSHQSILNHIVSISDQTKTRHLQRTKHLHKAL